MEEKQKAFTDPLGGDAGKLRGTFKLLSSRRSESNFYAQRLFGEYIFLAPERQEVTARLDRNR